MEIRKTTFYLSLILGLSCNSRQNEYDAEYWAKEYCSCIQTQLKTNDIYISRVICDSKLNRENRFFRTYHAQALFGNYLTKLDTKYADSVLKFNNIFNNYIFKNCNYIFPKDVNFDASFPNLN